MTNRQPKPSADRYRRFEAKVMPVPFSGCVIWLNGTNERGYGVFWNGERLEKAHRFAYRAYLDENLPDDIDLLHKCDVPCCVNPLHMRPGTHLENVQDMWAKSRATVQIRVGEAQTQAKLSDEKVARIRDLYATGLFKQRDLAAMYGVSQSQIWKVVNRKGWKTASGVTLETGRGR